MTFKRLRVCKRAYNLSGCCVRKSRDFLFLTFVVFYRFLWMFQFLFLNLNSRFKLDFVLPACSRSMSNTNFPLRHEIFFEWRKGHNWTVLMLKIIFISHASYLLHSSHLHLLPLRFEDTFYAFEGAFSIGSEN